VGKVQKKKKKKKKSEGKGGVLAVEKGMFAKKRPEVAPFDEKGTSLANSPLKKRGGSRLPNRKKASGPVLNDGGKIDQN